MRLRTPLLLVALLLTATACSVSSAEEFSSIAPASTTVPNADVQTFDAPDTTAQATGALAGDATDITAETAAFGPGPGTDATLTIGDQTWTFNIVLCTFLVAEGDDDPTGATISVLNDEFRLGISVHPEAGDFVDFSDFEFADPAISYSSGSDTTNITLDLEGFSGTGEFVDLTTDSPDLVPGTFSGTCS